MQKFARSEYSLKEMLEYVEAKFEQNRVKHCQIEKETKMTLTIKFRPLKVGGLDKWLYPSRFTKKE